MIGPVHARRVSRVNQQFFCKRWLPPITRVLREPRAATVRSSGVVAQTLSQ